MISLEVKRKYVKYQNVSKYYVHHFASGKNFGTIRSIFWESKDPKLPQRGHFVDAENVRKTLKIFNLATTNAIMMKLTTISIFI